jgi:hypothetical protein
MTTCFDTTAAEGDLVEGIRSGDPIYDQDPVSRIQEPNSIKVNCMKLYKKSRRMNHTGST